MNNLRVLLLAVFLILPWSEAFALDQVVVPDGEVGIGNDTIVLAEKGSVVLARKGTNVQYWPGSKLVHISRAKDFPVCGATRYRVDGDERELVVSSGASACATGDTAVVALEGSTVIYEDDVPLIRRPVVRRQR